MRKATAGSRAALLEAAIALAEEGGSGAIGLREAARRAGLTHGAPYRHFESREALVAAVAEEGFRDLLSACVAAQTEAGRDPVRQFQAIGVAYVSFAVARPGQFRVMYGAEAARSGHSVRSAEAAVFALAVSTIASAQRSGQIVEGDPQELAMVAWASVHGLAVLTLDGLTRWVGLEAPPLSDFAKRFTARVFAGLAPKR